MFITVCDDCIIAVNRGDRKNEEKSIVYREADGRVHGIDLAVCVVNYCKERGIDPTGMTCVGERDCIEGYFEFWTSGIKTRVVFPKRHLLESKRHRYERFRSIQRLLTKMGYSTLDLT